MATILYSATGSATPSSSSSFVVQGQAGTATSSQTNTILTPESKNWATYWEKKDPQAWSLVWDENVKNKATFYNNLKTSTPVYYSFDNTLSKAEYAKKGYLTPVLDSQKENVKKAMDELSKATGVQFVEATDKSQATMVISLADLGTTTYGQHQTVNVNSQTQHTVMLNSNWYGTDPQNTTRAKDNLAPGGSGYEALLHELAHAAGLDDANTGQKGQLGVKYPDKDSLNYTIMSYDDEGVEQSRTTYSALDKKALAIIYPPAMRKTAVTTNMTAGSGSPVLMSGLLAGSEAMLIEEDYDYDPDDPDYAAALATDSDAGIGVAGLSDEDTTVGYAGTTTPLWEQDTAELLADAGQAEDNSYLDTTADFTLKWAGGTDPATLLAPRSGDAGPGVAGMSPVAQAVQLLLEKQAGVLAQA